MLRAGCGVMQVHTVGVGVAIGQSCMLLSAGTKGKRFMLPHATGETSACPPCPPLLFMCGLEPPFCLSQSLKSSADSTLLSHMLSPISTKVHLTPGPLFFCFVMSAGSGAYAAHALLLQHAVFVMSFDVLAQCKDTCLLFLKQNVQPPQVTWAGPQQAECATVLCWMPLIWKRFRPPRQAGNRMENGVTVVCKLHMQHLLASSLV